MADDKAIPMMAPIHVRVYPIVAERIEQAVAYGWRRAHKYKDNPEEDDILTAIEDAVMSELCELFDFGSLEGPQMLEDLDERVARLERKQ